MIIILRKNIMQKRCTLFVVATFFNWLIGSSFATTPAAITTTKPTNAIIAVTAAASAVKPQASSTTKKKTIGGWSPVFFTQYNKERVNQIIQLVKEGRVARVKINYPSEMQKLAHQLDDEFNAKLKTDLKEPIAFCQVDIKDTATTKYRHDEVTVILHYN